MAASRTSLVRSAEDHEPMAALNITPLIDVLLVLLVMMILTIPAMTHEVPLDLPGAGKTHWTPPVFHRLVLDASGAMTWDGAAIAPAALPARLGAMRNDPDAELQFAPDGQARYALFDATLATIKRAGITRLGFVGNERFADFDH